MNRICIYGAGAMGTSLGGFLEGAGTPCDYVTRNPAYVGSLKRAGRRAMFPEEMTEPYDLVFLATKQRDNREIASFLLPYLKADGALITVQNGLPEETLAEVVGADRVYGCALGWGAEMVWRDEGYAVSVTSEVSGKPCLALGAYGKGERLEEIAALLRTAFSVTVGDLSEIRYSKLAVNAAFSTISAITGLNFGTIAKRYKKLALAMMRETVSVAEAAGCGALVQNGHDLLKLAHSPFAGVVLPFAMKKHGKIRSGMIKEIEAGRRCDVDFVAGAVVKAGEKLGVETPKLRGAVALVHDIENGLAELAPETAEFLCD